MSDDRIRKATEGEVEAQGGKPKKGKAGKPRGGVSDETSEATRDEVKKGRGKRRR